VHLKVALYRVTACSAIPSEALLAVLVIMALMVMALPVTFLKISAFFVAHLSKKKH
jgi:hypothetical protein